MACSSSNDSGTAGVGGHGGAGGYGAGGAPPAQGNFTLIIQPSAAGNCPTAGRTYVVGDPQGPSSISAGDLLTDGEHGATIQCSVLGSGTYTFSGKLKGTSTENDPIVVQFTNGVINADNLTGSATMAVFTPQLTEYYRSAEGGCAITVVAENVKPGSLWATASCPSIADASIPDYYKCRVGPTTTFVLANCDGS